MLIQINKPLTVKLLGNFLFHHPILGTKQYQYNPSILNNLIIILYFINVSVSFRQSVKTEWSGDIEWIRISVASWKFLIEIHSYAKSIPCNIYLRQDTVKSFAPKNVMNVCPHLCSGFLFG